MTRPRQRHQDNCLLEVEKAARVHGKGNVT
jgi:hypothetical protein